MSESFEWNVLLKETYLLKDKGSLTSNETVTWLILSTGFLEGNVTWFIQM
jgi:hypothetical protein